MRGPDPGRHAPSGSTSASRATWYPAWATTRCSTRDRRCRGTGCAGRCAARSSAPACSRAGPKTPEEAVALAESGRLRFDSSHHHHAIGPMSGIITPSMQVNVVRNDRFGIDTYSTLYMGIGKVLRHGAYDETVMEKLRWMNHELAPLLRRARPRGRRHRHQEHRRAGGADGRRDAQPQQGEQPAAARRAGAAPGGGGRGERSDPRRSSSSTTPGHFILNLVMAGCKGIMDAGAAASPTAPSSPRSRATATRRASG